MTGARPYKPAFLLIMAAFFVLVAIAAITQEFYFLLLPFAALLGAALLQRPLLLFYCLVAVIPWSVEYSFSESLGTDLPDEPLMLLASLAVVTWVAYHHKQLGPRSRLHPLLALLLVQVAWIAVTLLHSAHPLISFKYLVAKCWYLLAFVALPLLFFRGKAEVRTAAAIFCASMLLLMLMALVKHSGTGFAFDAVNQSVAPFFRNHVNYSALLVCTLPLTAFFLTGTQRRWRRRCLRLLLVASLLAVYFSYARGAWLAVAVGAGAWWLLKKRWLVTVYGMALGICLLAAVWLQHNNRYLRFAHDFTTTIYHDDLRQHLLATYELKDVSTAERFYRWIAGIRMVKDSWLTGFGPGTFYHHYKEYTVTAFETWVSRNEERSTVHNYFLLLLVEQGVLGLLLFLLLTGYALATAQRIFLRSRDPFWKATAAAAAVIIAMVCTVNFLSDLIETDKIGSVFYVCLSVLILADHRSRAVSEPGADV